ncbi:putative PIN domain protein [Candidatus Termititenax aidoneus]|uniref:PIN domain protein n=1 Tax=Termititenax aidoneus TaxID=2218524 RepID=A0A388T9Y4_TERA1|nr:putative PIN domain protein [Candidatus Termititenax aidoneus]
MKRLKLYLDTSVISYLDQQDALERMTETHKLWDKIKAEEFAVVLSDVTVREINNCPENKKAVLLAYLKQIKYETVVANDKAMEVAERFVDLKVLKQKSFDDCQHIAVAIISGCDVIVSWNFKHIVNHKTIAGVKAVTALEGYNDILIYDPSVLVGGVD